VYTPEYRPDKKHGNAEAMSRYPLPETLQEESSSEVHALLLDDVMDSTITATAVCKATNKDNVLREVRHFILHGWPDRVDE